MKIWRTLCHGSLIVVLVLSLSSCGRFNENGPLLAPLPPKQYTHIALLLPLTGHYAGYGKAIRDGFFTQYYLAQQRGTSAQMVKVYNTNQDKSIRHIYAQAVAEGADLVIGPLQKHKVARLEARGNFHVPVIALNLAARNRRAPAGFFQFALSPLNEAFLVANKAYQAGHRKAILIYPQGHWGENIATAFSTQWQKLGGTITTTLVYNNTQNFRQSIRNLLHVTQSKQRIKALKRTLGEKIKSVPRRRQDFDMIFLVAVPRYARQILPLLRYYYAGNVATYSISTIYSGIPQSGYLHDLNGVIFCDMPWILQPTPMMQSLQAQIKKTWPHLYRKHIRLFAMGIDAYALTHQINALSSTAGYQFDGTTGTLYLGPDHRILRQLTWAQFRQGKIVVLNG